MRAVRPFLNWSGAQGSPRVLILIYRAPSNCNHANIPYRPAMVVLYDCATMYPEAINFYTTPHAPNPAILSKEKGACRPQLLRNRADLNFQSEADPIDAWTLSLAAVIPKIVLTDDRLSSSIACETSSRAARTPSPEPEKAPS